MSNSLWPHEPQHTRAPGPSPTPGVHSNPCPLSRFYYLTITSSVGPFSFSFNLFQLQSLFHWVSSSHQVAKVLEFPLQHRPSNECSGLISFRMDWLDLLAVQGALKSLLQHHSSKASILRRSAFFIVQLSHPYMTTGKTIALTGWTLVGNVMSLLFNILSSLVIAFLPRSKRLLISWLKWTFKSQTDSCRSQIKPCAHQDPGEGSSDPTRDWPRLASECPGIKTRNCKIIWHGELGFMGYSKRQAQSLTQGSG